MQTPLPPCRGKGTRDTPSHPNRSHSFHSRSSPCARAVGIRRVRTGRCRRSPGDRAGPRQRGGDDDHGDLPRARPTRTCTGSASRTGAPSRRARSARRRSTRSCSCSTADGHGVYANDDWNRHARLEAARQPSLLAAERAACTTSRSARTTSDPTSAQGEIFQDSHINPALYPDDVLDANGFGGALPHDQLARPRVRPGRAATRSRSPARGCARRPTRPPPTVDLRSPANGARVKQGAERRGGLLAAPTRAARGSTPASAALADGAQARHEHARRRVGHRDGARQGRQPDRRDAHASRSWTRRRRP